MSLSGPSTSTPRSAGRGAAEGTAFTAETTLDLSHLSLSCLQGMPSTIPWSSPITCVTLRHNAVRNLMGMGSFPDMRILDLRETALTTFGGAALQPRLTDLLIDGSPIVLHPRVGAMALMAFGLQLQRIDDVTISSADRELAVSLGGSSGFAAMCVCLGLTTLERPSEDVEEYYRQLLPVLREGFIETVRGDANRPVLQSYALVMSRLGDDPACPRTRLRRINGEIGTRDTSCDSLSTHNSLLHTPLSQTFSAQKRFPAAASPSPSKNAQQHQQPSHSKSKLTRASFDELCSRSRTSEAVLMKYRSLQQVPDEKERRDCVEERNGGLVALQLTARELGCMSMLVVDNIHVEVRVGTGEARWYDDALLRLTLSDRKMHVFSSPRLPTNGVSVASSGTDSGVLRQPVMAVAAKDVRDIRLLRDSAGHGSIELSVLLLASPSAPSTILVHPMKSIPCDIALGIFKVILCWRGSGQEWEELYGGE